ncbi:hypothetical protein R1flu_001295 [Riccia fluitans]|uniref:Uncharacterized protein n=1 Tax=Riccia fluitans TaxID=41844 RepID=A0ABD1Y2W0_9MARC
MADDTMEELQQQEEDPEEEKYESDQRLKDATPRAFLTGNKAADQQQQRGPANLPANPPGLSAPSPLVLRKAIMLSPLFLVLD